MTIVLIEDEQLTAEDLAEVILEAEPGAEIVAALSSVEEAIRYFSSRPAPDLIFSDIQLGDGLSFDIFQAVELRVPVIFCTAFDEYAIKAFNANGIHYVLKPFNLQKIRAAFDKYRQLRHSFSGWSRSFEETLRMLSGQNPPQSRPNSVLVYYQDKVIPIRLEDIALFYIKNEATHLYTFDNKTYVINKTLDELQQLDEVLFYRANRQFILNRNAVREASNYLSRKVSVSLNVPFPESITISKEKITAFFDWLRGGASS